MGLTTTQTRVSWGAAARTISASYQDSGGQRPQLGHRDPEEIPVANHKRTIEPFQRGVPSV